MAAAGRILGLGRRRREAVFGRQPAQEGGTMQADREGSPGGAVPMGFNARGELQSCELSLVGVPPSRAGFAGPDR